MSAVTYCVGLNPGFGIFRAKCGVTKGVDSECKDYNTNRKNIIALLGGNRSPA